MPRDGSGTYTLPAGSAAVSGTTISSTKFNALINDLESDANTARPISAGGTGAGSATAARTALGVPSLTGSDTISGNWTISGNPTLSGSPIFSGSPDFSGVANAATIRTDLGLAIGTDVQAQNAALADIAGITGAQGDLLYFNGTNWVALAKGTAGQALVMNSGATAPEWATFGGIGVDQTWQDVSASRSVGTSYQNTTGKPIMVGITVGANQANDFEVSDDNSTWILLHDGSGGGGRYSGTFIIPDNWYYRVINGGTPSSWAELR